MMIDWVHFSPWQSLTGGVMIGFAVALLLLLLGRIAGISGIVGGLFQRIRASEVGWRLAFILGLIGAPFLYQVFSSLPEIEISSPPRFLILAGVLVGFGTRLGSGCTSGHGVCGLSRLSPRSFVATGMFMTTGFVTVFVIRHLIG